MLAGHIDRRESITTGNEDFKINKDQLDMNVFSIPTGLLKPTTKEVEKFLPAIAKLYTGQEIAIESNEEMLDHLVDSFGDILCIKYAIINPFAMIGQTEDSEVTNLM